VKVAVFGTGYAEEHVRGYQARDDVEVAVVCARRQSSAECFALEHGIPFATSSYEEALSFPGLTAVSIATPPVTHAKIALAAINRGLHVLCEKPLALDARQAVRMLEAAEAAHVVHATNFDYRVSPNVTRLHELLRDGFIGTLRHGTINWMGSYHADPEVEWTWRNDRALAGPGMLGDLNHGVDYIRWLFGDVERVVSNVQVIIPQRPDTQTGEPRAADTDDLATFMAVTTQGATIGVQMSRCATAGGHLVIECFGSEGMLRLTMPDAVDRWTTTLVGRRAEDDGPRNLSDETDRYDVVTTEDRFIETIKARIARKPEPGVLSSFRDGVAAMRLVDAIFESSCSRVWIPLAPPAGA
jgi:predicted dehydrogenase